MERQEQLFAEGKTKARAGQSRHNSEPSQAVDIVPYPIDWDDRDRFVLLAGYILQAAGDRSIALRWGGDWKMSNMRQDNGFDDLVHFELIG